MSAMVPYIGPAMAVAGYAPGARRAAAALINPRSAKRARMMYAAASHMYRNRGKYRRAASLIGRAWRRSRKRRIGMGRIGQARGVARAKRTETETLTNGSASTRVLYNDEITNIPKTTVNDIDARQRDVVRLSGFKMCFEIKNNDSVPLLCNYAVVYDKQNGETVSTSDFFRSNGGNERAKDFSVLLNSYEFHCLPLNTDRFTVLWHRRFVLAPNPAVASTGFTGENRNNWKTFEKYVKLKKHITFEGGVAQSKLWLLRWYDKFQQASGGAITINIANVDHHVMAYWREPKS